MSKSGQFVLASFAEWPVTINEFDTVAYRTKCVEIHTFIKLALSAALQGPMGL